jgi:hypothetical protein
MGEVNVNDVHRRPLRLLIWDPKATVDLEHLIEDWAELFLCTICSMETGRLQKLVQKVFLPFPNLVQIWPRFGLDFAQIQSRHRYIGQMSKHYGHGPYIAVQIFRTRIFDLDLLFQDPFTSVHACHNSVRFHRSHPLLPSALHTILLSSAVNKYTPNILPHHH